MAGECRDRMTICYVLPITGGGRVEVLIESRLKGISEQDAQFLLQVLDRVNEFARIVHPAPAQADVPPVLRGVGTQDRGQRA